MATKKGITDSNAPVTAKINPALDALARPIAALKLDDRNARKHERRSIDTIKTSLSTYGQQKPIVALTNGVIIAGNGTLEAARELGWDRIAVVTFDNEDEARARAFAIMDNRSAELSDWDAASLLESIQQIDQDLIGSVGFNFDEIAALGAVEPEMIEGKGIEQRPELSGQGEQKGEELKSGEPDPASSSHVRMVQLFLSTDTHPVFMQRVRALSVAYGKDNVTDIVFDAVEHAFNSSVTIKGE